MKTYHVHDEKIGNTGEDATTEDLRDVFVNVFGEKEIAQMSDIEFEKYLEKNYNVIEV